jgi:hypothetical protein
MKTLIRRGPWIVLALLAALAAPAVAQVSTGNIYGTVTDESGAVLPGVTVALSGPYGTKTLTTGTQGEFRFLNLDQGRYTLKTTLTGFGHQTRDVTVNTGANINLEFKMKVATVEETVTITAEAPIVDTKKVGTSTTITKEEIAEIPNARDPWAMLRTVPGVIMDRVNIGGNENGQQANFVGKGDNGDNTMWNLDGVVITDNGAVGASPTYYDFDAFEEISISTGGSDLRSQTGGIGINLVTRRGTNKFRGSAHGFLTHDDFQSTNLPDELVGDPRLKGSDKGDHIQQISDYGFELGGPIVKDKLWFYGSWGKQDVRLTRITQTADKTKLTSYNVKLNWQPVSNDMVSLFYFNGAKTKDGRSVGIGTQEDDTFLWDQSNLYSGGPHGFTKAEWNHTFSPKFFLSTKYSYYNTGFFLHPRGGDVNGTVDFDNGNAHGAYYRVDNTRPAHTVNLDANYYKAATGGGHEFKFGFGYRKFNVTSDTHWGGNQLFSYVSGGTGYTHVSRDAQNKTQADYWSGYAGDTFTKGRMTLNLGVRWDKQTSKNLPSSVPANASFPDILGPITFDGNTPKIEWNDFSPRVGVTVALDESRKTALRASYARYASQLPAAQAAFLAPTPSPGAYFAYLWDDNNHDGFAQPSEVRTDLGLQYFNYVNVNDPNGPSPNHLDPDYSAQHDSEFIVGLDRELAADFAVSLAYTYRRTTDATGWTPRTGFTAADYTTASFARNGLTATGFVPDGDKVLASGGSRTLMNRPDYHRTFNGFEASIIKRLSHKWMARVAFTYNNPLEYIDGPGAISNPSHTDTDAIGNFSPVSGPLVDGGEYPTRSAGSGKGDAFINAKWQIITNALVELPAGFELSGAFFGREGHPRPIVFRRVLGFEGPVRVLADQNQQLDTERLPNIYNLDLRLAKNFKVGPTSVLLSADLFNVFNSNTELSRFRQASSAAYDKSTGAGAFNRLDEILNPRVFRLGLRFQF